MKKALDELPEDLYAAYESILERIFTNGPEVQEVVLKGLSLLMYATRALSISEMQEALAVERWSSSRDPDNVMEPELLMECFSGLVVLQGDAVQFVHDTVREFLSDKRKEVIPSPMYLAKVCITYALFDEFKAGPIPSSQVEQYNERIEHYPLLEYVAHNWSACVPDLTSEEYDEIVPYVHRLLASPSNVDTLLQVRYAIKRKDRWWIEGYPRNSSPLHVVARTGLQALAEYLVHSNPGPELLCLKDSNGRIPLHEAIEGGHFKLVPLLLGETARPARAEDNVDLQPARTKDNEGMTALHHAAVTGNQDAMKQLLKGGADISVEDRYKRTPLERALQDSGQQDAATALLEALIEVDGKDLYEAVGFHGYSALHIATLLGYNDGIRRLLKLDFNPAFGDKYAFTPLHIAAEFGHVEAMKLLLSENSGGKLPIGEDLRTPAHLAAFQGHDEIIDLLLEADKEGCLPADESGLTPLHWAAFGGHLGAVEKLLPVIKNAFDNTSKNPIYLAMWGGHRGTADYLRSNSPYVSNMSEIDMDTVFSLETLETLASGRNWYPSAGSDIFDSSFLLREAGRSHLRRKHFELASVCFDLSVLIYGSNFRGQVKDPNAVIHPEKYCNRCMTLPIKGICYTCARCNFGAFTYDLCANCFEKRWQFAHIHDHYIPIPRVSDLPEIESLLESLKAASME
jgi:ankyrin repeat protein